MSSRFSSLDSRPKVNRNTSQPTQKIEEKKEKKKRPNLTSIIPQLPLENLGTSDLISRPKKSTKTEQPTKQEITKDSESGSSEASKTHDGRSRLESLNFFSPLEDNEDVLAIEEKPSGFKKAAPSGSERRNLGKVISSRERKKLPASKGPWKAPSDDIEFQERELEFAPRSQLTRQKRVLKLEKFGRNSSLTRPEGAHAHQGLVSPQIALHIPVDIADPSSSIPPEAAEMMPEPIALRSPVNVERVVNRFAELTLNPDDAGSSTGSEGGQHN